MAQYKKQTMVGGAWAKASDIKSGTRCKIMSETNAQPSQFLNKDGSSKTQDVCKVRFEGMDDVLNVSLNRATINGLVDAFGEDSKNWQNHYLSAEIEKVRVAGVARVALYLVPEGYEKVDDENGYAVIVKEGAKTGVVEDKDIPVIDPETDKVNAELAGEERETNLADIPF